MTQYVIYPSDMLTRFCLPANYAGNELLDWNQEKTLENGGPWARRAGNYTNEPRGMVGQVLVNSGSLCTMRMLDYSGPATIHTPVSGTNWFEWSINRTNHKFQFGFYLDNDLEETDSLEIYDDDETFWSAEDITGTLVLSEETTIVVKGNSSLKIVANGSSTVRHNYPEPLQDWSQYEFFTWWWYGANSDEVITLHIYAPTAGDRFQTTFTDDFTGWKRFVVPLAIFSEIGSPDWTTVDLIDWLFDATETWYLDRVTLDVGNWVKVEVNIPDNLALKGSETSGINTREKVFLYTWNGSAYVGGSMYMDAGHEYGGNIGVFDNTRFYFLDGTTLNQTMGANYKGGAWYQSGKRGELRSPKGTTYMDGNAGNITYSSYYGCEKRIAFAIKMPPHDGLSGEAGGDSSTTGISQCKLKVEICHDIVEDTSGYENHGVRQSGSTINTGPVTVDGKFGKALDFDISGDNEFVKIPHSSLLNPTDSGYSLLLWFYQSKDIAWNNFMADKGGAAAFDLNNEHSTSYKCRFAVGGLSGGTLDASFSTNDLLNKWHHLACIYDPDINQLLIYLDGSLDNTVNVTGTPPNTDINAFYIGAHVYEVNCYNGLFDEVLVYNRALSLSEIGDVVKGCYSRNGLVGEWKFEFGNATFEFEDSTHQYYGLKKINDLWACYFNETTEIAKNIKFSQVPTGFTITASEDDYITKMVFEFYSGESIQIGKEQRGNIFNDEDGDDLPDIFDPDWIHYNF